ncbi:MAG: hydrolase, partial [Candidatus Dadabacteria bacterium]|nr:hydrolase [Candidatus Dadabacteria bacterium]
DAAAGVTAGASGAFGLVIGVARKQNEEELFSNGADMVVSDLGEFGLGA